MHQEYQLDHSLNQYIEKMKSYGVVVNAKLLPALFSLKNGLKYPGLLTSELIDGSEELVKVPLDLILTAHKAMKESELQSLFANTFYRQGPLWQDRILITFILYLLSTGKKCIWTYMAQQFSKNIDIISFWEQRQFDRFIDRSVIKAAKKQRKYFEEEWKRFTEIQDEYDVIRDNEWFTKQNYKWIYIHTISRCFGSYLNSTYFVPFCELFNHNSVDVSYICTDENMLINIQQSKTQAIQNQSDDSVSSGYSEDYLSDDDFDYMSINSYTIKWFSKISYDLKDKQTKVVEKTLRQIYEWMDKQLQWKGFTFMYLGQIIQKLKILENQYKAGRKKFQYTLEKIQQTKLHVHAYRKYLIQFYKSQGRQYQKIKVERGMENNEGSNLSWNNYQKTKQECKQKYTHFKMQARDHAHFNKESQVFFSYGKLSNRTLLIRYGFSLQNNPYEHVWVKIRLGKQIEPYPDLFESIQSKGLSVNYKFKLKSYTLAIEPIIYFRMCQWKLTHHTLQDIFFITDIDRELKYLSQVKDLYQSNYGQYADYADQLNKTQLSYHQYFVLVYNLEKKKIILLQIQLITQLIKILQEIQSNKKSVKDIQLKQQYRNFLKHYMKGFRGLIKS